MQHVLKSYAARDFFFASTRKIIPSCSNSFAETSLWAQFCQILSLSLRLKLLPLEYFLKYFSEHMQTWGHVRPYLPAGSVSRPERQHNHPRSQQRCGSFNWWRESNLHRHWFWQSEWWVKDLWDRLFAHKLFINHFMSYVFVNLSVYHSAQLKQKKFFWSIWFVVGEAFEVST